MYDLKDHEDWLVCTACGTQFPTSDRSSLATCKICDDPRQYTPPAGQSFTTLRELREKGHKNEFHPHPGDDRFVSVVTVPKVAIGQRAILVRTSGGNVLWDCLTYIDDDTVKMVKELGGLQAIVISHPHYYSTHLEWAKAFDCPVYLAAPDRKWVTMEDDNYQKWIEAAETRIKGSSGWEVLMLGGHFPGSLVLLYDKRLLIADTLMTNPAGMGNWKVNALGEARQRPAGMNTFSFMWSIPNMIPLSPPEIYRMWDILKRYEFTSTHGAFLGQDIEDDNIKERVRESAEIQIRAMGSALCVPN